MDQHPTAHGMTGNATHAMSAYGSNGLALPAAALMDHKAMKQHANGTSLSHFDPLPSSSRYGSEPLPDIPLSSFAVEISDTSNRFSMDDAYSYEAKAKPSPQSAQYHPRQLLDPRGFSKPLQSKKPHMDGLGVDPTASPNGPSYSAIGEDSLKRDQAQSEGQGMGNFIERMHNVSQADRRPLKKQKMEHDDDIANNTQKANFKGGKGGGDLGEFVKQKQKEGLEEAGTRPIVDLTEGESTAKVLLFHL